MLSILIHACCSVCVLGNGPSGICLSLLLSGYWPYFSGSHPNPVLREKLNEHRALSLVEQVHTWEGRLPAAYCSDFPWFRCEQEMAATECRCGLDQCTHCEWNLTILAKKVCMQHTCCMPVIPLVRRSITCNSKSHSVANTLNRQYTSVYCSLLICL